MGITYCECIQYVFAVLFIGVLILGSVGVFALNGGAYHQMTAAKYNADGELAQILKDPFLSFKT